LEITLQFGFMCMFAAVFPWGPACAFFWNLIEIRVDAIKLLHSCQRPLARARRSIGAWNAIFWILLGFSVVTNSYFVAILSPAAQKFGLPDDDAHRYQYFAVLQYGVVCGILAIYFFGGGAGSVVADKLQTKTQLLQDKAVRTRLQALLRLEPSAYMNVCDLAETTRQSHVGLESTRRRR
jgi:hypothetical protein